MASAAAPPPAPAVLAALQRAGVACSTCSDAPSFSSDAPHIDHPAALLRAWARQDVDMQSTMLGSTTPFGTHILVASGQRDWAHDAAGEATEAGAVLRALQALPTAAATPASAPQQQQEQQQACIEGVWRAAHHTRRVLTASSALALHEQGGQTSVMLFPHWTALSPLTPHNVAAAAPWLAGETQALKPPQQAGVARMVLPYTAVVLLCSHKKRDVRCHLSASLLSEHLRHVAEAAGWEVDERGDFALPSSSFPSSSSSSPSDDDDAATSQGLARAADGAYEGRGWGYIHEAAPAAPQLRAWRRRAAAARGERGEQEPKKLGMFYCSHIGGHRYAANMICYFPNGAGVWYGRLDPVKDAARV
ncbi:hypothetical protein FA09DRAFT_362962, partial [Tilletiopsis washingtonensis]